MENSRRARRHLQRAQELLGFGSNMNFGEGNKDDDENSKYYDPLTKAVEDNNKERVDLLTEYRRKFPFTILFSTLRGIAKGNASSYEIAELLIQRGADANTKSYEGNKHSMLWYVCVFIRPVDGISQPVEKALSLIKLLLEKGAECDDELYRIVKDEAEKDNELFTGILKLLDQYPGRRR